MNILQAVILGIVQGFAEFLPISSSGHLVLFQKMFGLKQNMVLFDVAVHVGTLVPICVVFWKDIWALVRKPFQKTTYLLVVATLPAVVAALLFGDAIDALFKGGLFLAIGFIITGVVLMYSDMITEGNKKMRDLSYLDALIIGCVQAIAIAPGISRSGSTITAAQSRKVTRQSAAKFSFLMSIPAVLGGLVLQVKDIITGSVPAESITLLPIIVGLLAAMLAGYLSIRFMLKLIYAAKLRYFSYYVFAVALFILFDSFITHFFFN